MTTTEKVALVNRNRDLYGLNQSLRAIGLPKSTWYYHQNEKETYEQQYADLLPKVEAIAQKHPDYGWPRVQVELREKLAGRGCR